MHLIYDNFSNILWSGFSFFYRDFIGILCVLAVVFCFLNSRFFYRENVLYVDIMCSLFVYIILTFYAVIFV